MTLSRCETPWRRARRGLTLVEVIVSMFILSLTVIMVGGSFGSSNRVTLRSQQTEVATQAARQQLEEARQAGYEAIPIPVGSYYYWKTFTAPSDLPNASGWVLYWRVDDTFFGSTTDTGRCLLYSYVIWKGAGNDGQWRSVILPGLLTRE